jgi:hypothetical protein
MASSNLTKQERRQLMEEFLQFLTENHIKLIPIDDVGGFDDDVSIINHFLGGRNG